MFSSSQNSKVQVGRGEKKKLGKAEGGLVAFMLHYASL